VEGSIEGWLDAGAVSVQLGASSAVLLRAADQVLLHVAWRKLALTPGSAKKPARLAATKKGPGGVLIVGFGPQHVREEARSLDQSDQPVSRSDPATLVAHASRVALRLRSDDEPIPFTVAGVLDALTRLPGRIVPVAAGTSKDPREPKFDETAIEIPGRLILSPDASARWLNHSQSVARRARHLPAPGPTELWHARLSEGQAVKAVWNRTGEQPAEPEHSLPDADQRDDIVKISAGGGGVKPVPVKAHLLALSTLGGWLESELSVPIRPAGTALSLWRHVATLGRDQHVKVVDEGFLFPWGHRAALIQIVDREFGGDPEDDDDGNPAGLVYRQFLLVRQPVVTHGLDGVVRDGTQSKTQAANEWPFARTEIRTRITPPLVEPVFLGPPSSGCFEPRINNPAGAPATVPFQFLIRLHTLDGGHVDTLGPAYFVPDESREEGLDGQQSQEPVVKVLAAAWAKTETKTKLSLGGRRMPLAAPGGAAGTAVGVQAISVHATVLRDDSYAALKAQTGEPEDPLHPIGRWVPRIVEADVLPGVVSHFTGRTASVRVKYQDTYLQADGAGFDPAINPGGLFLEVVPTEVDPPFDFSHGGDRTGGMVQPSFSMAGLSRESGPVGGAGDLMQAAQGGFDPHDFFAGQLSPMIFGVVPLTSLLSGAGGPPRFIADAVTRLEALASGLQVAEAQDIAEVAAVRTALDAVLTGGDPAPLVTALEALKTAVAASQAHALIPLLAVLANTSELAAGLALPREVKLSFDWTPGVKTAAPFYAESLDHQPSQLTVHVQGTAPVGGGAPNFSLRTTLTNAHLELLGGALAFIQVGFRKLEFSTVQGKKPDVVCELEGVNFVGVLSFVEALKDLIPLDGFSDPPALTVDSSGVRADFSLALPDLAFGMFSLQNMALSAGFTVPFIASPMTARFGFCSKESPALLTVSGLGGGGYLAIVVDPKSVEVLEAGFDFGASLAVNFGVASGEVHVMGGFIYAMVAGEASLTGFLRIGGSVEVIGLIHASIELSLSLTYEPASGKCTGAADLAIEVSIAFFSTTVHLHCERKFAGSDGDPPFIEAWAPDDDGTDLWAEYLGAFA